MHLGAQLKESRRSQGLTIEQLASATGLTKGFISRVERDQTSPSVATLLKICQVLSVPVGSLFEEADIRPVELDTAPLINMGGSGALERLVTPRGESRVQVLHSSLEPGADGGAELYTINCDVEVVHMVAGELELRFPGRTVTLRTGDTVTFPGSEPHSWTNRADVPAQVLWTLIPAAWSGAS